MKDIEKTIKKLKTAGMALEVEDHVAGFLGVHIARAESGKITMTQTGLIDRIVKALNIGDKPNRRTPAAYGCLGKDEFGDPAQGTYSYPSVIGMLGYLKGHTRPGISFAVAQCARWTHKPMRSHVNALEHIGQYLQGTSDKGLIFQPPADGEEIKMDCYVDADLAGLWGYEDDQDPSCVKNRTGFVIFFHAFPVIKASKLQLDIALSKMESENNALLMAMRDVLPLLFLTKNVMLGLGRTDFGKVVFKAKVHEDTMGTMILGRMGPGRMTPRSMHYGVKYHWFRSKLKPNGIEFVRVETDSQRANFLTKSL